MLYDGLKTYHKLDGNSNDLVGNSDGVDTAIVYAGSNGIINDGAGLNGSTSEIVLANPANARPTGNFTVNFWMKTSTKVALQMAMQNFWDSANFSGWKFLMLTTGVMRFYSAKNTGIASGIDIEWVDSTVDLSDGNMHMITGRYNGINLKINVDAADEQTTAWTNAAVYSVNTVYAFGVEKRNAADNRYRLNGAIDEPAVLDRDWSDAEMIEAFNSGAGKQPVIASTTGKMLQLF